MTPSRIAIAALLLATGAVHAQTGSVSPDSSKQQRNGSIDYSDLPDVLECNQFDWMENCEALNKQAKRNPQAPIRAKASDGTEYTFAPQTPTTVITHMLNPTLASARAMVKQERQMAARDEQAAELARQAIIEMDGSFGFAGFENGPTSIQDVRTQNATAEMKALPDITAGADIDTSAVKVFVFYSSMCSACHRNMTEWHQLAVAHPDLSIRLLQIDRNPNFLQRVNEIYDLPAARLAGDKKEAIISRLRATPTVWIQSQKDDTTRVIQGYTPMRTLERAISTVSKG